MVTIKQVDTFPLLYRLPQPYGDANGYKKYRTCCLFRLRTESGLEGWGECVDWLPTLELGFRERIVPFLIGKAATNRRPLVKIINKWHQRIATGVSMALTEIAAKAAGLSICDLWGGRWQAQVPVYASFQSYSDRPDWQRHSIKLVEQAVAAGFDKVKVKIGGKRIAEDQKHIQALQSSLAGAVQIALDANQSYDAATAMEWQRLFSQWDNLLWLEEPLPMNRTADYKLLRSRLSIPLAGGENLQSAEQFLPLLAQGAIDIAQPDTMHLDGIDSYRSTLETIRQFGLRVSPHAFDGALSRLYALFAQACLPPWSKMADEELEPVEWDVMENPLQQLVPLAPSGGRVTLPDGVGLGVELDLERIAAFRWDERTYI